MLNLNKGTFGIVGIALIAVLSLGVAGYATLTPHSTTITQQQFVTNTQNFYATQTQTVTSFDVVTSTISSSVASSGPVYYQTCGYYGCAPAQGYVYTPCTPIQSSNSVQCYGYLIQNGNGCLQLSVRTTDPDYWSSGIFWVHYSLQNLPASYPPVGSWVTINGQLSISNTSLSADSASCSPNTLTVTSITATSAPQP